MFEVANALVSLGRRKRMDSTECRLARHIIDRLRPVVDEEGPKLALDKIWDRAEKHAPSVYDAGYLELALRRSLPLASRDAALNKAAAVSSITTLL